MPRKLWTKEEDKLLKTLAPLLPDDWETVAFVMCSKQFSRTALQCRRRWHDRLHPSLNLGAWSLDEEKRFVTLHQLHGNCWEKWPTFTRSAQCCREMHHNTTVKVDRELSKTHRPVYEYIFLQKQKAAWVSWCGTLPSITDV